MRVCGKRSVPQEGQKEIIQEMKLGKNDEDGK